MRIRHQKSLRRNFLMGKRDHLRQSKPKIMSAKITAIRQAFGDYVASEGCSCCRNIDNHERAAERLGELLGVDKYSDNSGYDFTRHRTINKEMEISNGKG